MIEISSRAKTASRKCDEALSLDYFDMTEVKDSVEKDVKSVLTLDCPSDPCISKKLSCQFPRHETLLNELRTCAKIVTGKTIEANLTLLFRFLYVRTYSTKYI